MEKQIRKSAVDLTDLAIGIIVLGIVVSIGAVVMLNIRDARLTSATTVTTSNETLSNMSSTATQSLANTWVKGITRITNDSGGGVIPTNNYTTSISAVDGTATINVSDTLNQYNNSHWNVTYDWYNTTDAPDWTLANETAIGLAEYGSWFKIIVIVGVAAVVLSLIFMAFGRGRDEAGGSY